jgi:hypothetical protein
LTAEACFDQPAAVTSGRGADAIRPGDAWCSRSEREYFITVIRPAERSGWWVIADGGNEREVSVEEITSGFVLDSPWA